jgi:hypothetical protein
VCGHTHHYVDQSHDEAFGKVGPKWPVKLDGVPGEFLHFKSGKILFVPEHTRLVK